MTRVSDHAINRRARRSRLAAAAGLLVLAAFPGAARAARQTPPIHHATPSPRATAAGPGGSPARAGVAGRAGLPKVVLLVPGSGYGRAQGSSAVQALQRRLAARGAPPGPIDGRYGPLTTAAVKRFQAEHGLQVDGITGPQTLAALAAPVPVLFPSAGQRQPHGSPTVRTLQRRLAAVGAAPGPLDGRYGPLTTRAVERFQATHGLRVDGIVGARTWRALSGAARAAAARPPREHPAPPRQPVLNGRPRRPAGRPAGRPPRLPVELVLLALAALGLLTASLSHARTSARVRHAGRPQPPERPQPSHPPAPPAGQPPDGILTATNQDGER
jgi:peptidoglycan hydrolase-like protein with peptidoglycan-binding domain